MKQRKIADRSVGAVGLGCMGMSWLYGTPSKEESLATLDRALELGVDFWDTADVYGAGDNERLLAGALKGRRDKVFLATKFANVYDRDITSHQDQVAAGKDWIVDGTPAYVRKAVERSLERLEIETIDLYYQHRVDPLVPIEETVGEMVRLKEEGKIRHLGLSEASAASIRRAYSVHPIAAVQSEYSLWTRDYESDVIPLCQELGITFVPYSPLGRGFLTGTISKADDLEESDWRRNMPRFQPENMQANLELADKVKAVASEVGCTPAQVALAWVLGKGEDMVPIPGTKRVKYLEDNAASVEVRLTAEQVERLEGFETAGARYAPTGMSYVNG
ncbi:MAG: aldo/keto reductase [Armatimonadetes bacterium]|nr:aldo/keto reductase [Armatimonadota bacterium]